MTFAKQQLFKPSSEADPKGFTLVEMLVVLGITSILAVLVTAGFQAIMGSTYDSEASDLANTLIRARAYAMANNTYVFVGMEEVNASTPSNSSTQAPGTGRVGVCVVASNDGTPIYLSSAPTSLTPNRLTVVLPLRHFENLHLTTSSSIANLPDSGASAGANYNPANSSAASLVTFNWPLLGTQYSFGNNSNSPGTVIQFNPQGEAQIVTGPNTASILQWIEIDLVPSHESSAPDASANPATILIDGASGSVSTFRA